MIWGGRDGEVLSSKLFKILLEKRGEKDSHPDHAMSVCVCVPVWCKLCMLLEILIERLSLFSPPN